MRHVSRKPVHLGTVYTSLGMESELFGKKNDAEVTEAVEAVAPEVRKGYTPKKETATPTRKQASAARMRPIVADKRAMTKEERKAHKRRESEARNAAWNREQEAMRTGDERHMPAQYAGPVRRFARDYMDSRFQPGVVFMPMALVLFIGIFFQRHFPSIFFWMTIVVYAVFILAAIWTGINVHQMRITAEHKFGVAKYPRGLSFQSFSRAFYPRRWRTPRPMVARGEYPKGGAPEDLKEARAARKK